MAGSAIVTLASQSNIMVNRKTERRRLSRADKTDLYPQLIHLTEKMIQAPVWPDGLGDHLALAEEIHATASKVRFFAPKVVDGKADSVRVAAQELATSIGDIRANSRPGHHNTIDQRFAEPYHAAVDTLTAAVTDFTQAAKKDLEI
ncbi:hypothetical protein [Fodinicola feengrottensis]|uniref:hypothetical protein n=1 Tax=Fodinicola feengrottensis TaxID=435914 RepID=UPI0031DCAE61